MVHAYHIIFNSYGFWLPNDPRGSWSDFVAAWELVRFGKATRVTTRRSLAGDAHDRERRLAAKEALLYPPIVLTGIQAASVGRGFARAVEKSGFDIHACSILPEHVHLVIGRHGYKIEQAVNLIKGEATKQLKQEGLHPLARYRKRKGDLPTPWAARLWKVFLDSEEDIDRAILYVENNSVKEGKPRQAWPFVTPFKGLDTNVVSVQERERVR